jgi:hypothetical protein
MPLSIDARALIRSNLEELQNGERVRLVVVGALTEKQLSDINQEREPPNHPPIVAEIVFIGHHAYKSRVVGDGYTIDDVVDQIASGMDSTSVVIKTHRMTAMENPNLRADRYGNLVRDRVVFECSARHPRPELFSVVPKGDCIKPKRPLNK